MHLNDHLLTQTEGKRYGENITIVVFSCIYFEPSSIKQISLNKQEPNQKDTCYKWLVQIFLHNLEQFSFIFTCLHPV